MTKQQTIAILAACLAALSATPVLAQAGDHQHEPLGEVRFPVSCAAAAQPKFDRAMTLYHSFAFARARAAFQEIMQTDPGCGMAWWGQALVAANNPFNWPQSLNAPEGEQAIRKAKEIGTATPRERGYIDALATLYADHATRPHRERALAFEGALEQHAARHPDDAEARVLHALVVSGNHDAADKTYARPLRAAALLEPLLKELPKHPGVAHYLVHSYDYPPLAHRGIDAAQRFARIAADDPHAQHMPSHIYTRVGQWHESIASNRRSIDAAKGDMRYILHAWDYTVYAQLQLADDAGAAQIAAQARAAPMLKSPSLSAVYALAALPARIALEAGRWRDAARLERPANVAEEDWQRFPQAAAVHHFARALGAARGGDVEAAQREVAHLHALAATLKERKLGYWAEQAEIQALIASAWQLHAAGRHAEALAQMRAAADREDATEKNVSMPGFVLPARELLADLLLEQGRLAEALAQYEASMKKEPGRFRATYGAALAAERAGDSARAKTHYEAVIAACQGTSSRRAEVAQARQALARAGHAGTDPQQRRFPQ